MDIKITIDITERLEKSLQDLSAAIFNARVFPTPEECRAKYFADVDPEAEYISQEKAEDLPVETPETHEAPITQPEPETPQTAPAEAQETTVHGRIVENPDPDPLAVSLVAVEPAVAEPVEKPKKKKAAKKATEAPKPAPASEAPITQPEPETPQTAPAEAQETTPKPESGDPMGGMTVIEAMQALTNEIQEKGIDLAQVNSRVRIKANELGLSYGSAACLIKAIGYVEARKIALGEK